MNPLARRLSQLIDGVPKGGAVTLPREAVARWLEEVGESDAPETNGRRPDVADLTVEELAEELDRAESTVRGWLNAGEVDGAYKLHGQWRVPRDAWRAHLDSLAASENGKDGTTVRSRPSAGLGDWRGERESE